MELEGIEAAITAPNVILHYGWQDMPINNIQQFRVRFSFVNESHLSILTILCTLQLLQD